MSKRYYRTKTREILFGRSGNQCAYPECAKTLISRIEDTSEYHFNLHICHIRPVSEKGPRAETNSETEDLNSPDNLILLCPNHHKLLDDHPNRYPVEKLKKWKLEHEAKVESRYEIPNANPLSRFQFLTELVDREIEKGISTLRKSRFLKEFDSDGYSLDFAGNLAKGKFSWGTDSSRSRALAWCVRILSPTEDLEEIEGYLGIAKNLKTCDETQIAEAFVCSRRKEKVKALELLADIDSPMSRSAKFMIVSHQEGFQGAIDWLDSVGIDPGDLDADGKYFLLALQLKLAIWNKAQECLGVITDEDLREVPALHDVMAITYLVGAAPEELRTVLSKRPPFEPDEFLLDSDENAICACRKAHEHFVKSLKTALELGCPKTAKMFEQYAFWLELNDPEKFNGGKQKLEERLRYPESALHLVRLALHFGINLDVKAVEREIDRQTALHGKITDDAAFARAALIFSNEKPEDVANYIHRYLDDMVPFSDRKFLQVRKIAMLSEAGLFERAEKCLAVLSEEGLSETEHQNILKIIDEARSRDPVEIQRKRFKEKSLISDLIILIGKLEAENKWDEVCEYAQILLEKNRRKEHAEKLANALNKARRNEQLVEFIKANQGFLKQSNKLQMLYCFALYRQGSLVESHSRLKEMDHDPNDADYRQLRIELAVSMGDWSALSGIVSDEFSKKDERSAEDLMYISEIAVNLNLPGAKELTTAMAEKEDATAEVLSKAYLLASSSGWENDKSAQKWLGKAVELSGEDGPVLSFSLKDVLDRESEWGSYGPEIWQRLVRGEIPMSIAAKFLNMSLLDLMLLPALTNPKRDPRQKKPVPAYSGNRPPVRINTGGTVGIDATALITLSFLGLLDRVLDAFNTVYVPHSTLPWLFEEKRRIRFHQPSLARDARKMRDLLENDQLEKLAERPVPDDDLSAQVGCGLATLIAEAENTEEDNNTQHLVVRSSPVHSVASLLTEQELDLTAHSHVLVGCRTVVDKLWQNGQITSEEKRKAYDYLQLHEKPWPNEPEIATEATLYLDDLSVYYFLRLGILEKLKTAGFRPIVSPEKVSEMRSLLSRENISDRVDNAIEDMRAALGSRIKSGKVKLGRQLDDEPADRSLYEYPTAGIFALAGHCDIVVVDDRFVNQYDNIENGDEQVSVFSTLDLLDSLLSNREQTEQRSKLRSAGYFFVPVDEDELRLPLGNAKLKAIRENFLQVQMSNWLQLPKEWFWTHMSLTVFIRAIRSLWTADSDFAAPQARADWVIDRTNITGWLQRLCRKNSDPATVERLEALLMIMLVPATKMPEEKAEKEYQHWLEHRFLTPIKEQHPDLYSWIAECYKKKISEYAGYLDEIKAKTGNSYDETALAKEALNTVPPSLRETLLADPVFRGKYELKVDPDIQFESPAVSFKSSEVLRAIRKILSGTSTEEVTDAEGRKWKFENTSGEEQLPNIEFSHGDERGSVSSTFVSLSPDTETRLRFLEKAAFDLGVPRDAREKWRETLKERALEDHEVEKLNGDLLDTPAYVAQLIRSQDVDQRIPISFLVPRSRKYFERLAGKYDGSETLRDYASGGCRTLFRELSQLPPYDAFLSSLFLSSHSALTTEIRVNSLDEDDFVRACDFLERQGDRVSQLGAVEAGLRVLSSMPGIEPCLVRLIKRIRDDEVDGKTSGFKLFSALFILVDGELSRIRLFSSEPPFYRKLAALSQAALIHRQMANSSTGITLLHERSLDNFGGRHYLQSLVDMRMEPHWNRVLETPEWIKLNFISRIMIAARKHERNIKSKELSELVLGTEPGSICSILEPFSFYLPGPLDGTGESLQCLPAEKSEEIRTQVTTGATSPSSFVALANSALFFRLDPGHVELATKALKSCSYKFATIENSNQLVMMMSGLATVAAVTRSPELADELRIVARRYRADVQHPVSVSEETMICLISAASHAALDKWTEFVGNWMTELAFIDELGDDEASMLRSQLRYLCHAVPDLWVTCDRACAALAAIDQNTSGEQGESLS